MTTKPVVLVVDDEVGVRNMMIDFLEERFDCKFREARDGEEAVAFVQANPCDIMLLDIRMPKKSGMTVIKEVKEIKPNVDILVVSAWVSDEVAEEATKLGATDYAVKPMDLKVIALKLGAIFTKRGQEVSKI